jgi:hypothetical protein
MVYSRRTSKRRAETAPLALRYERNLRWEDGSEGLIRLLNLQTTVPSDVANKQADLVDRRLDAVARQSDRNCTDAHLEKHLSKLRGWEMAYKVVVRPNPSQNNSTGPEAGQGWKQSPNADGGDKDTAIRLEMYIKPRKKEVTDQRTGKDSHQLKEVRSDRDKNTPHQPKRSVPEVPKTQQERRDTPPLSKEATAQLSTRK